MTRKRVVVKPRPIERAAAIADDLFERQSEYNELSEQLEETEAHPVIKGVLQTLFWVAACEEGPVLPSRSLVQTFNKAAAKAAKR